MKIGCHRGATIFDIRLPLILTVVLTAVVGCNNGTGVQSTPSGLADQARLTYDGEEWDAYGGFLTVVRITNRSEREISYAGYSTSHPVVMEQLRGSDSDGWRDRDDFSYCAMGLGTQRLRARQSATFTLLPPKGAQSWRVGIKIEHPEAHVIWTEPITANEDVVPEAPGAAELVQTDVVKPPDGEFPYTFTLKNVSARPLFYGGYQEPHVPPIYLNQEECSNGWQGAGGGHWSGTGVGFKELPPGGSISFLIPAQSRHLTWRTGIRLFKTARPVAHDDAYSPVWWEPCPHGNRLTWWGGEVP